MKKWIISFVVLVITGTGFYFGYQKAKSVQSISKTGIPGMMADSFSGQQKIYQTIAEALKKYYHDHKRYPDSLDQLTHPVVYLSPEILKEAIRSGFHYTVSADRQQWKAESHIGTSSNSTNLNQMQWRSISVSSNTSSVFRASGKKQNIYQLMPFQQSQMLVILSPGSNKPPRNYQLPVTPDLVVESVKSREFLVSSVSIAVPVENNQENLRIHIQLDPSDTEKFAALTQNHIQDLLVVKIGNEVVAVPKIMEQIPTGNLMIPVEMSKQEAFKLIQNMNEKGIELYCVKENANG